GCFSSFLGETRTSQSVDAELKDFVLGKFSVCDARITGPSSAVNEVGQPHAITYFVEKKDTTTGFGFAPASGVTVTATITSGPGPFVGGNRCAPGVAGPCSSSIVPATAGTTVVNASAPVTIQDVGSSFIQTVTTSGTNGNSGPFTKQFVDANIQI